jgi:cell division protein FtsI (penicillin-binding protein 3)
MEVNTGEIRAMVNLGLDELGRYREVYNYAIGESSEPGSTFKLPR